MISAETVLPPPIPGDPPMVPGPTEPHLPGESDPGQLPSPGTDPQTLPSPEPGPGPAPSIDPNPVPQPIPF